MQNLNTISWVVISILALFIIRGTFRYLRKRKEAREIQEAQRLYRKDIASYSKYSGYRDREKTTSSNNLVPDVSIVDSYLWDSFGSSSGCSSSSSGCSSSGCSSGCGGGCGGCS